MNIIELHNTCQAEKLPFLQAVELVEALAAPSLLANNHIYRNSDLSPNSDGSASQNSRVSNSGKKFGRYDVAGVQACSGLASSLQYTIFPSQVDWFKFQLSESDKKALLANGATLVNIEAALSVKELEVKHLLAELNYQSAVGGALHRTVVEDNCLVIVTERGIRSIPFRNIGIKAYGGEIKYITYAEEVEDPKTEGKCINQYTYVRYPDIDKPNDNGEVYQQLEGEQIARKITKGINPNRVFIVYGSHPDGSYVESYAVKHYGLINEINQIAYDLSIARSIALKAIMFLDDPSEQITPSTISNMKPGDCLLGNANSVGWVSAAAKISEWSWCQNSQMELKQQLAKSFALDILNYTQFNQARSAAEINALTNSIDSKVASFAQTIQATLAPKLITACLDILAERDIKNGTGTGDLLKNITPVITSGTSAFNSILEFQKLIQGLQTVATLDPTLGQRIDSVAILKTFAAATGINTDEYIKDIPVPSAIHQDPRAIPNVNMTVPPGGING